MFSVFPPLSQPSYHQPDYLPRNTSPLSPSPLRFSSIAPLATRDVNRPCHHLSMTSQAPKDCSDKVKREPELRRGAHERDRLRQSVKKNPLIRKKSDERETRRQLFLKKVRESSEDQRWAARGGDDEMMRKVWLAKEKDWLKHNASLADFHVSGTQDDAETEDLEDHQPSGSAMSTDEEMAELVAQQEAAEIEALLSQMEAESAEEEFVYDQGAESTYGSDDDEYNDLFIDIIQKVEGRPHGQEQNALKDEPAPDPMDMS